MIDKILSIEVTVLDEMYANVVIKWKTTGGMLHTKTFKMPRGSIRGVTL